MKAAEWYRKAAASGSNEAKLSLASMMESGHGMPVDPTAAVNLYREAMGITGEESDLATGSGCPGCRSRARKNARCAVNWPCSALQADTQVATLQAQVAALKTANASRKSDANKMAALESSLKEAMQHVPTSTGS